jgi:cytochrome bd-type quinol oxidase subunit 2
MKRGSTLFLKAVILLIGIGALAGMIIFPQLEGRNTNADLFSIYFQDPFLAYVYIASIPFFFALYQAFQLLGYIGQNKVFSLDSVRALRTIKYCAIILSILIVMAALYIRIFHAKEDDPAGFIALCIVTTFISVVIATATAVFERLLQSAVDIKSENDLTV